MVGIRNNVLPRLVLTVVFAITVLGCQPKVVMIGSPDDRYDHNRTRKIMVTFHDKSDLVITRKIPAEVYVPFGSDYFPAAVYVGGGGAADDLRAANVVPVFTGIALPLSDSLSAGGKSDRKDLIDFLAQGPFAQAGVEPGAMAGDTKSTEDAYTPVLDLLASGDRLSDEREGILKSLPSRDVDIAEKVIDGRYNMASFQDVLAIKYKDFWFILFKLPSKRTYSRLVVVSAETKGQDFRGKRP